MKNWKIKLICFGKKRGINKGNDIEVGTNNL